MVQFEHCGFSLKTGSLIFLSIAVFIEAHNVGFYSIDWIRYLKNNPDAWSTFIALNLSYHVITSVVGVIVSVVGIYGIWKKKPGYLNGSFYFCCYEAIHILVTILTLLVDPSWNHRDHRVSLEAAADSKKNAEDVGMISVKLVVVLGLVAYFAIILRSYRDAMREKLKQKSEVADPTVDSEVRV